MSWPTGPCLVLPLACVALPGCLCCPQTSTMWLGPAEGQELVLGQQVSVSQTSAVCLGPAALTALPALLSPHSHSSLFVLAERLSGRFTTQTAGQVTPGLLFKHGPIGPRPDAHPALLSASVVGAARKSQGSGGRGGGGGGGHRQPFFTSL